MGEGVKTRVSFHIAEGEIVLDSLGVEGNTIFVDVTMPALDDDGQSWRIRELDGLTADPTTGAAVRDGIEVRLPRLEMQALLLLIEAHPRGVTYAQLRSRLGPGSSYNTLKSCMNRLKRSVSSVLIVESVHGVGWRLILPKLNGKKK